MDDEIPDIPLENFGGETGVAAPPAAEPAEPEGDEPEDSSKQTTQPTEGSGSEGKEQPKTENAEPESKDNSKPEEQSSQRPEKRDRLQARFGELTGKLKAQEAQIAEYEAMIARTNAMSGIKPVQADENGQFDVEAFQKNQAAIAQAEAQAQIQVLKQQMEREQFANSLDIKGAQIEKNLSDEGLTNPIHAENIMAEVEERVALANGNPQALKNIDPVKIAERYIRAIKSERRSASSTTQSNLQNIQAEQAVQPNAPSSENLDEDAALEARLADIKF